MKCGKCSGKGQVDTRDWHSGYVYNERCNVCNGSGELFTQSELAMLKIENSDLKAQLAEARNELEISEHIIKRSTGLLAEIAIILKGEPKIQSAHDLSDLPQLVSEASKDGVRLDFMSKRLRFLELFQGYFYENEFGGSGNLGKGKTPREAIDNAMAAAGKDGV